MSRTLPWRMNERNYVPAMFYAIYSNSLTWYLYLNIYINWKKPIFQPGTCCIYERLILAASQHTKVKFSRKFSKQKSQNFKVWNHLNFNYVDILFTFYLF